MCPPKPVAPDRTDAPVNPKNRTTKGLARFRSRIARPVGLARTGQAETFKDHHVGFAALFNPLPRLSGFIRKVRPATCEERTTERGRRLFRRFLFPKSRVKVGQRDDISSPREEPGSVLANRKLRQHVQQPPQSEITTKKLNTQKHFVHHVCEYEIRIFF